MSQVTNCHRINRMTAFSNRKTFVKGYKRFFQPFSVEKKSRCLITNLTTLQKQKPRLFSCPTNAGGARIVCSVNVTPHYSAFQEVLRSFHRIPVKEISQQLIQAVKQYARNSPKTIAPLAFAVVAVAIAVISWFSVTIGWIKANKTKVAQNENEKMEEFPKTIETLEILENKTRQVDFEVSELISIPLPLLHGTKIESQEVEGSGFKSVVLETPEIQHLPSEDIRISSYSNGSLQENLNNSKPFDPLSEEVMAVILEEKINELEEIHRQEIQAVLAMSEAENQLLKQQVEKKAELESEVGTLKHHLSVVKELTEYLLEENKDGKKNQKIDQSEIDELGARLEGEIQRRKEIEEELQSREAQLENLREHLREVEGERANLTVELRDSLAAYKELSDRCEHLACELEASRSETRRIEKQRENRQRFVKECLELAEAEELVGEKMRALGAKELEFEQVQKEVEAFQETQKGGKTEASLGGKEGKTKAFFSGAEGKEVAILREKEWKLREDERKFEERQAKAAEELSWLRNVAGEAVLLAEEVKQLGKEMKVLKSEKKRAFWEGLLKFDLVEKGLKLKEENEAKIDKSGNKSLSFEEENEVEEEELGEKRGWKEEAEGEFYRRKIAEMRWKLAESRVSQVKAERAHWKEVESLNQQLSKVRGRSLDSRLLLAQNEIHELKEKLLEQQEKFQELRKQAEASLALRDEKLEELKNSKEEEKKELERQFSTRFSVEIVSSLGEQGGLEGKSSGVLEEALTLHH